MAEVVNLEAEEVSFVDVFIKFKNMIIVNKIYLCFIKMNFINTGLTYYIQSIINYVIMGKNNQFVFKGKKCDKTFLPLVVI